MHTQRESGNVTLCGYLKVISWIATCVSWAPYLGLKVHTIWDKSEAAMTVACQDFLKSSAKGMRRKASRPIYF
jgi:hypothetical protein